jgi:acyl-CoA synthetase (AMP-forming)/AMP-acid ligase II
VAEAPAGTVRALIEQAAKRWPQAVYACDVDGRQRITFAELRAQCLQVAALLRTAGSAPGDTVSLVMPNGLQTLRLLLGAMHGGWCVNPVNLLSQPDQMRYVLEHSDCKVVFASSEWAARVQAVLSGLSRPVTLIVTEPDAQAVPAAAVSAQDAAAVATGAGVEAAAAPTPGDLALLMYTSGTTGMPKGVMLTQANLAANAQAISAEHALVPGDRVLAVLPLYHINAFAVTMLAPLAHGGSLAMPPKFSAGAFWQQALDTGCTWINVVPTMISYLLEGQAPPRERTQGLRFCRSASSALPPEHLRAFEQRFGISVIETMGLTETVAPAFSNPLDASQRKIGAVGRASGGQARVVDAALQPVPDGTTGEIVIQGPHVMRGYYKNEKATAEAFTPDGWLRTGDLGHRDADGFFFVTGRIKELIIKGGENIAPREIDEALLQHPAVLEAAAVGIPDRHYGQEILACIVPREGMACTEADLRAFCLEKLGRYKTPGVFRFVSELPRGPSGKVQRLKLAQGEASR